MRRAFKKQSKAVFAILALSALAACGDTLGKQALIGGGAGLGTAAVLDGNLAAGALVGAAGNVAYCQSFPERCK
ncbi:hypothetical protein [Roseovarius sp. M141]|uniref:hypothetical protein n=1 Tax=Roseovarius sp. M141 TaxID=2583806 RepID=UPI0020CD0D6A|nr:hypothetical protein [Roseovarius sp. M141]MCQ0092572.1 hypothetical protein [Roseovarius sp. M141]